MKLKNVRKTLSTITYDQKIAKRLSKTEYYAAESSNMRMYEFIQKEKSRLSTPKWDFISRLLTFYKELGSNDWSSPTGKTLLGIYKKNKNAALEGHPALNTNVLKVLAKPELLLLAYRAIRGNRGALTKAGQVSSEQFSSYNDEQKALYYKTNTFPDKFSLEDILLTSKLLGKGLYPWGSSRRIYVPKPGAKDKMRPITIPPFMDRVVQKAICLILEAIYEPSFELTNRSFGFRPNKGTQDAIVAVTSLYSSGKITAIEGDIEAAYDTVNKTTLLGILSERIMDRKFLNMMRKRLDYDYVEKGAENEPARHRPVLGIPQGGIDSPYLFNIYMSKLDEFIHTNLQDYLDELNDERGTKRKLSRWTMALRGRSQKSERHQKKIKTMLKTAVAPLAVQELRTQLYEEIRAKRRIRHLNLKYGSTDPQSKTLKLMYVRYADDWILTTNANKAITAKLKERISDFLNSKLGLKLSDKKTMITDIRKEPAHFLGFQLKHPARGPLIRKEVGDANTYKKFNVQRRAGTIIWAAPDRQRLINRLYMKGFCQKDGTPKEMPWLATLEAHAIIERYNSVMRGFAQFYIGFIRNNSDIQRWIYILRFSCIKTLAQKYKTTIGGIFRKYGHLLTGRDKTVRVTVRLKVKETIYERHWTLLTYRDLLDLTKTNNQKRRKLLQQQFWRIEKEKEIGDYPSKSGRVPTVTNDDYLEKISWVSLRTQASFAMPCANCGELERVHQHHIRHIRKTAYCLLPDSMTYKKVMALRNRKQIPLCEDCHIKLVHSGKYNGPGLINLIPNRLMDNRIVHVESFIKPGVEYHAKSLEEKGWTDVHKKDSLQE